MALEKRNENFESGHLRGDVRAILGARASEKKKTKCLPQPLPQIVLDHVMGPILLGQPRTFAIIHTYALCIVNMHWLSPVFAAKGHKLRAHPNF
jgi:hypothetical protein